MSEVFESLRFQKWPKTDADSDPLQPWLPASPKVPGIFVFPEIVEVKLSYHLQGFILGSFYLSGSPIFYVRRLGFIGRMGDGYYFNRDYYFFITDSLRMVGDVFWEGREHYFRKCNQQINNGKLPIHKTFLPRQ